MNTTPRSWTAVQSAVGTFAVAGTDTHVTEILLPGEVLNVVPSSDVTSPVAAAAAQLTEYFNGQRTAFDLPLRSEGTPFQEAVWATLVAIPFGTVESYGWLADQIGRPRSARPVGQALARNPLPLVRPCHRVVGATGLGGYGGGPTLKRALLAFEGVNVEEIPTYPS
jgi:methylated-DNA-[protein]-cysteine S-methyltransferase